MSAASFLRVKKLKGAGIIQVAARHNLRRFKPNTVHQARLMPPGFT